MQLDYICHRAPAELPDSHSAILVVPSKGANNNHTHPISKPTTQLSYPVFQKVFIFNLTDFNLLFVMARGRNLREESDDGRSDATPLKCSALRKSGMVIINQRPCKVRGAWNYIIYGVYLNMWVLFVCGGTY